MDPNAESPIGCMSLRLQYAAASLSNCATWQAITKAASAASALSHVYEESLPPPRNGTAYAEDELANYRPYALLAVENIARTRTAFAAGFDASGEIALRIVREVPAALRFDWSQAGRQFNNIVGQIIDELIAQADTPGRLAVDSVAMAEPWYRTETDEERADGDLQIVDLVLSATGI